MTKIALLGVGRMGHELAVHLLAAGHDLTVWNRTTSGADRIVGAGARRAASPEEAMRGAEVVMTALFGPDAVREVVLAGTPLPAGAVWLDVTTVSPADADAFAEWAAASGVRYVHGPVVGSLAPARAGALGVLLGGDPRDVAVVEPLAALWADPARLRVVEDARTAASGKLLANLALGVSLQGLVEALRLGNSVGVDTDTVLSMLAGTGLGFIAGMKGPMIGSRDFDDTQFSVDLLAKDARLVLASTAASMPAVQATLETLDAARAAGRGDSDISVVVEPELAAPTLAVPAKTSA
jgi:3-hydroxyisobutyrate dehydrogenase